MLTMPEIVEKLKDRKLRTVADACGISYPQLWRIAAKKVRLVSPSTMEKLSNYLEGTGTQSNDNQS